ncbi:MAG: hypothetical protein PHW34_08760 [Hespellia sp.]|nr:hypothetical protein [Hespellia sp.]
MYTMKEIKKAVRKDRDLKSSLVKTAEKDAILFDITGDKVADIAILDVTGDGNADTIAIDTIGDGYFDTVFIDTDGNNIPDTILCGNLQQGVINEAIQGPEVETIITEIADTVISTVMEAAFTEVAVDTVASSLCTELEKAAKAADREYRTQMKERKKAETTEAIKQQLNERKLKIEAALKRGKKQ